MKRASLFVLAIIFISNCFCLGFSNNQDLASGAVGSLVVDPTNHNTANCYYNEPNLYLKNCSTYYFKNLTENYGRNMVGSCGYISLAMLLSYYDSYLNDGIIPENYDKSVALSENKLTVNAQSPGVLSEPLSWFPNDLKITNDWYLENIIKKHYDTSFHLKLIDFRIKYNEDIEDDGFHFIYNTDLEIGAPVYRDRMDEFLSDCIYEYLGRSSSEISYSLINSYDGATEEVIRNFVVTNVKNGNPVFLGMQGNNVGGHAFIAYDYDEQNDELYGHLGFTEEGYSYEHVKVSTTGYNIYLCAFTLNVNLPHVCSNNYVYTDYNGVVTTHCPCELSIHPNHVHSYLDKPIKIDETNHNEYCSKCGEPITSSHSYTNKYVYKNKTNHNAYCACGAMKLKGHAVKSGERYCLLCGGLVDTGFAVPESNAVDYVTENGSYILPNGVTVLAEADVEAYLNGTLRFYGQGEVAA